MGKTKKDKTVKRKAEDEDEDDEAFSLDKVKQYSNVEGRSSPQKEDIFTCRVCGNAFNDETGTALLKLCDFCADDFDLDKIWNDVDRGKIIEEELEYFDIEEYRL